MKDMGGESCQRADDITLWHGVGVYLDDSPGGGVLWSKYHLTIDGLEGLGLRFCHRKKSVLIDMDMVNCLSCVILSLRYALTDKEAVRDFLTIGISIVIEILMWTTPKAKYFLKNTRHYHSSASCSIPQSSRFLRASWR